MRTEQRDEALGRCFELIAYTGVHPLRGKAMFQIRNAANASKTVKRHDIVFVWSGMCADKYSGNMPQVEAMWKNAPYVPKATCLHARAAPPL